MGGAGHEDFGGLNPAGPDLGSAGGNAVVLSPGLQQDPSPVSLWPH